MSTPLLVSMSVGVHAPVCVTGRGFCFFGRRLRRVGVWVWGCFVSVHASVAALEEGCLLQQRELVVAVVWRGGRGVSSVFVLFFFLLVFFQPVILLRPTRPGLTLSLTVVVFLLFLSFSSLWWLSSPAATVWRSERTRTTPCRTSGTRTRGGGRTA